METMSYEEAEFYVVDHALVFGFLPKTIEIGDAVIPEDIVRAIAEKHGLSALILDFLE